MYPVMQLLSFSIGPDDYAIETRRVVEVLPLVSSRPIAGSPHFVRGVFVYRGQLVPLIDLGLYLAETPLRERLSTRVIVVEFYRGPDHRRIILGIAAENVLSLCSDDDTDASLPTLSSSSAPFLGRLLRIHDRFLRMISVEHLLPPELLGTLVAPGTASTGDS